MKPMGVLGAHRSWRACTVPQACRIPSVPTLRHFPLPKSVHSRMGPIHTGWGAPRVSALGTSPTQSSPPSNLTQPSRILPLSAFLLKRICTVALKPRPTCVWAWLSQERGPRQGR